MNEVLESDFTYHPPKEDQIERYKKIRDAGKELAYVIINNSPASHEQSTAIAKVREAIMWANAGIACNE